MREYIKPLFSKKHYEAIASMLEMCRPVNLSMKAKDRWFGAQAVQWELETLAFADLFGRDNPSFDRTKFLEAADIRRQKMWTKFWDMHSGGGQKEKWAIIYIEAPEAEARVIFYNRFGHNPDRVTCTCCGSDYSVYEGDDLSQLTAFHRGCQYGYFLEDGTFSTQNAYYNRTTRQWEIDGKKAEGKYIEEQGPNHTWEKYQTLEQYIKREDVLVIYAQDIKPKERRGTVPEQGYVWKD